MNDNNYNLPHGVREINRDLLNNIIRNIKQTETSQAKELVELFVKESMAGNIVWHQNVTQTIQLTISKIDSILSKQVSEILHHPKMQKLEGSWRGLHSLVSNSNCSHELKIKVLDLKKSSLANDLKKVSEFDQSQLFKKSMNMNLVHQVVNHMVLSLEIMNSHIHLKTLSY